MRKTYVHCPTTGKLVEKGTEQHLNTERGPMVIGPLEPFVSPVTGETITSREQLRRHNRAHGVTDARDYSPEWYQKKEQQRQRELRGDTPRQRRERIEAIQHAMNRR